LEEAMPALTRLALLLAPLALVACFDIGKSDDDDDDDDDDGPADDTGSPDDGGTAGDGGSGDAGTTTDIGDGGTAGDGGGGDGGGGDGGGGDGGGSGRPFVPTVLLVDANSGILRGEQATVTYEGAAFSHTFAFYLVDDDWTGVDDTENACIIVFDTEGADTTSACEDCWEGLAWTVDGSMLLGTEGACDRLDPEVYTEDVGEYFASVHHGYGFGPISGELYAELEAGMDSYAWEFYKDKLGATRIQTDLAGDSWYELNSLLVYAVDERTGELVTDGEGHSESIELVGLSQGPGGYYDAQIIYGFSL
jgi:hypothetical protein